MTPAAREAALRALAADLDRVDVAVYAEAGRDPLAPILGEGAHDARVAVFGRDPGRHEVIHGLPFIGAGGQKVRAALWRALRGGELPSFDASVEVGRTVFWANMVPYKPVGNKVWSARTRAAFAPVVRDLLVHGWGGTDVLVLGREPFLWFGLGDRAAQAMLDAHWARADRYEASVDVRVVAPDGASRAVRLHPLPHPSPLNATWAPHVPRLLDAALARIGFGPDTTRCVPVPPSTAGGGAAGV